MNLGDDTPLLGALEESNRQGPLGEDPQRALAVGARFAAQVPAGLVIDLGAGGGVPGLVIAWHRPDVELRLVERRATRADLLRRLVLRLGLGDRCTVFTADAADIGRSSVWRHQADAVVARSFGAPAILAEAAAPLLRLGGRLLVSEPPDASERRWPASGLELLGMEDRGVSHHLRSIEQITECPDHLPRRRISNPLFVSE
jgi:16S rRNA (guanine527-N7)-methyltransferase